MADASALPTPLTIDIHNQIMGFNNWQIELTNELLISDRPIIEGEGKVALWKQMK